MLSSPWLGSLAFLGAGLLQLILFAPSITGLEFPFSASPSGSYETILARLLPLVTGLGIIMWVLGIIFGMVLVHGRLERESSEIVTGVLTCLVAICGTVMPAALTDVPLLLIYVWMLAAVIVCAMGSTGTNAINATLRVVGAGWILYVVGAGALTGSLDTGPVVMLVLVVICAVAVPLIDVARNR